MAVEQKDIDDLRREMRKLIDPLAKGIEQNTENITNLGQTVSNIPGNFADIVNFINNSHPEWSKAAYLATGVFPNDAGDNNLEAYNIFRQLASDTTIAQTSANALKALKTGEPADHTLWAANEAVDADIPRWDKVNGTIEMGGITNAYDLLIPMPNDIVFPGQTFYVQFEAMLRTSTALPDIQAYAGIYDNTAGQRKFIEGGSFTITDDQGNDPGVTYGIPGATSVDYKAIAYTDSGEQAESNILNFPNAPATFNGNNHPRVKFSGVPGFIKFEIYRLKDGVYTLQHVVGNSIDGVFYDIGNPPVRVVDAFPTVTLTKPRAYAITSTFVPGSLTGLGWIRQALTILVPTTYNRSVTGTGMQYLRIGFNGLTTDARQVLIRKLGLSMGSGKWARSPEDIRTGVHSSVSSSAAGAGSGGGGGIDPPPPGGGGGCVLLDSTFSLIDRDIELQNAVKGDVPDSGGAVCGKLIHVKRAQTGRIFRVVMASGLTVGCTFDHPFITSKTDFNGTPCDAIKKSFDDGANCYLLTRPALEVISDKIVSITEEFGDFWVGMPCVDGPHTVILNGFLSHNLKDPLLD